jgi:hypothetical protein
MILALDPGPVQTGYVLFNAQTSSIIESGVRENNAMLKIVHDWANECGMECAIEMVASYGMPVGAEVFETCVWVGRYMQEWWVSGGANLPRLIYRKDVKMHLCGQTAKVNDAVIRRRLIDIFGPPGKKASPGKLFGVKSHAWPALAVAITAAETSP